MAMSQAQPSYIRIHSNGVISQDKSGDDVELQSMDRADRSEEAKTNHRGTDSLRQSFPWMGITALTFIVLLTVAAVGVLIASGGSPIDRWQVRNVNIQPQVWLSILTTIMDGITMVALADAAVITYWRVAARGTTLRHMYDLYESHAFVGAINNLVRLRPNKLAIVSVLCLVSSLRGPLFQRSSVVMSNVTRKTSGTQQLHIAQLIPPGFMFGNGTIFSKAFDEVYESYIQRAPIRITIDEVQCGDVCTGKVKVCTD